MEKSSPVPLSAMVCGLPGALSATVHCPFRNYHGPLHTGFAQVIYEEPDAGDTPVKMRQK